MGLNNAQKYAKFLKRKVPQTIFFHKSDEMADFGRERHDSREKWRKRGGDRICNPWTIVMQVEIPLNAFAFRGMVWYDDVGDGSK